MSINKNLAASTLLIIALTVLAKPFGVFKEIYVAYQFGTGKELDAFYIAFTIPTFIVLLLSGSIRSSFIPVYLDHKTKNGDKDANILFNTVLNLYVIVLLAAAVGIFFFRDVLIKLAGPGFDLETQQISANLLLILCSIVLFDGVNNLLSSELNAHKRFIATTVLPVFIPASMIAFLYFGRSYGIYSLALGNITGLVIVGVGLTLVIRHAGVKYRMEIELYHPGLGRIFKLMLPLLIGSMLAVANTVVDRVMASTLPVGSVSSLGYADRIIKIFQSVIIMAISTASLPYFSEQVSAGEIEELKKTIILIIRFLAFLFIPITLGLLVLSKPLVSLLFERGEFGPDSALLTYQALVFYSLGLFFMALIFVFSRVFHAIQQTKVNMYAAFLSVSLNICCNLILMRYMGAPGIALSTSIVNFIVTSFLLYMLFVKLGKFAILETGKALLHILAPAILMSGACIAIIRFLKAKLALEVGASIAVGFASYILLCSLFKVPEFNRTLKLIKQLFTYRAV